MKVMTFKMSPKKIFGIILVATGLIVVLITFFSNHVNGSVNTSSPITCSSSEEGVEYLTSLGWTVQNPTQKEVTIPLEWDEVYENYNKIQLDGGYDLTEYKGKNVTLYTYEITNFDGKSEGIVADLLVFENQVIGGDICNTSAKDGFIQKIEKKK